MSERLASTNRFRDRVLGWWSSHPYWINRRDLWLRGLALAALGALWSLFVRQLGRIDLWLQAPIELSGHLIWFAAAATAILAGMISISLCGRMTLKLNGPRMKGTSGLDQPLVMSILVFSLFMGLIAPIAAFYLFNLPPRVRLGMHLMAVLPILALLTLLRLTKPVLWPGHRLMRHHGWLAVATLLATVAGLDAVSNIGWLRLPDWLTEAFRQLGPPLTVLFWCAPMAAAAWALWLTSWHSVPYEPENRPAPQSLFGRLWAGIRDWFRGPSLEKLKSPEIPPWLSALLNKLPEGCRQTSDPVLRGPEITSPLVERPDLVGYFGGRKPTEDQVAAFTSFARAYEEAISLATEADARPDETPSCDFLLFGEPGSGRTTTLLSYASFAALVRGQHVLVVTATARKASILAARLTQQLAETQSDYFVRIGCLGEQEVNSVVRDEPELPQIWIGTVDQIERHLFGSPVRDARSVVLLSHVISLIDVVLVDDVLDIDDVHRVHLPFTIDKIRLICDAELVPVQVIVASRPIPIQGARMLGAQLLGRAYRDDRVLTLHPRPTEPGWYVQLTSDHPRTASQSLAVECLKQGLEVVVYCANIDALTRDEQQAQMRSRSPDGSLRIVTDLDELSSGSLRADAILHVLTVGCDAALELRLRTGDATTVIITLASPNTARPTTEILPVVVDRRAAPLVGAHTLCLHRFLPPATPISLDAWTQFGIRPNRLDVAIPSSDHAVFDLDESAPSGGELDRALWGMTSLRQRHLAPHPVDVYFPTANDLAIFKSADGTKFFPARNSNSPPREGIGRWRLENGQELRKIDLVHESELLLRYDNNTYVPLQIRSGPNDIEIIAGHFNGDDSDDAFLPVIDLTFEVPSKLKQGDRTGSAPNSGGLYWCQLETDPVLVQCAIVGRCSRNGIETPVSRLNFIYPAQLTAIILGPQSWPANEIDGIFSQFLSGSWGSSLKNFDPILTSGASVAFAQSIVGVRYFARFLAARLDGDQRKKVGQAIIWLIEPTDTGRSASTAILEVLRDPKHRDLLLCRLRELVADAEKCPSLQALRRFSQSPTAGDTSPLDGASDYFPSQPNAAGTQSAKPSRTLGDALSSDGAALSKEHKAS